MASTNILAVVSERKFTEIVLFTTDRKSLDPVKSRLTTTSKAAPWATELSCMSTFPSVPKSLEVLAKPKEPSPPDRVMRMPLSVFASMI